MMSSPLVVSVVVLWILVLGLAVCVIALSRQIGILYERIAPMGALMIDGGPAVGERAPLVEVRDWEGKEWRIGAPAARSTLLFFVSPGCPVCKKLLPIVKSVAKREAGWLEVVLASDGNRAEHEAFRARFGLERFRYVLSSELGMTYRISKLPYCVLLDAAGTTRAKGLVNSREQFESLFSAYELKSASVQAHLAGRRETLPATSGATQE
jgi:methylamine dehydrogenase accessory protein MauD